ncbi:hypothetical protein PHYPSEUDO_013139 [Phytophthora pseudosyringae]|uniref:Uncharacterized protein n=1 Tax=Phytophthora pseudosyringae TaxID=221518 RepID=A0A8T1V6B3_9STRA|nr:hypothetical protein PHYPSEUDO_013139 [Phytophthora pseudosyringae]
MPPHLRTRSLRPVLLLLIFFFVLLPLLAYNFATFDFQRVASFERRFRAAPSSATPPVAVPACLGVASQELLRAGTLHALQTRCGAQKTPKSTGNLRLVHFVNVALDAVPAWAGEPETGREQFTYVQFAALQSARRVLRPDVMMMHYYEPPRGVWYTQCQRHLGLHQVLPPVSFDAMQKAGPPFLARHERRRVVEVLLMLRALKKQGGVAFSDFNTFLLRRIGVDMQDEMVVASQARGRSGAFSVGLHLMQAPAGHPFVEFLEQKIVQMVEANDPKLHEMALGEVLGQIVLEKYLEEHGDHAGGSGTNATTGRTSIMDGVAVGAADLFELDGLHELLKGKPGPSLAGKFRDVAGVHVDKYDFAAQTADTDDLREIARMQQGLTLAEQWQSLDTLIGAVVRLAVVANTTAELEPLFT